MKNLKKFKKFNIIKEGIKSKEIKILFKDLREQSFGGSETLMMEWLNANCKKKKVYFISTDNSIIYNGSKRYYIVREYAIPKFGSDGILVIMDDGRSGTASGLIYIDGDIDVPKSKYKRIKRIDIDPYDEEDWWVEE